MLLLQKQAPTGEFCHRPEYAIFRAMLQLSESIYVLSTAGPHTQVEHDNNPSFSLSVPTQVPIYPAEEVKSSKDFATSPNSINFAQSLEFCSP